MEARRAAAGQVDHYARLGLARHATSREVAAAFRRLARLHHPDVGGSADEFAALEEAYRVLRDPASRAAYDAACDAALDAAEPGDDWDDLGWGVPLDVPPAAAPTANAAPEGPPAPDRDPYHHASPPPGQRVPPAPPRPGLAPFGPGALALPVLDPGPAEPVAPVPRWVTTATAAGAATAWVALLVGGVALRIGLGWFVLVLAAVPCGLAAFLVARPRRWGEVRAVFLLMVAAGPLTRSSGGGAVAPHAAGLAALLILAALLTGAAERLRWSHRHAAFAAQREARARRAQLLDRRSKAVEWNRVREALRDPSARALCVGPWLAAVLDVRDAVPRPCWDPTLGASVVHRVPAWVAQGWWVALDGLGDVTAVARPGAPEAWLEAMAASPARPGAPR